MSWLADYPGAIVVPARWFGYGQPNRPKAWALHTPEEPADDHMGTPYYLQTTDRQASAHYFVSFHGFVCQLVPESEGAYANAVEGKTYPVWADSKINLNLQTLSIEIEGMAATIHQTMPRGSAQWNALVNLMAHRCKALNIPPGRTFPHKDVSIYRSDPGQLNIPLLVTDVIAAMEGEDEMKYRLIRGTTATVYMTDGLHKKGIPNPTVLADLRKVLENDDIVIVSDAYITWLVPF